MCQRKAEGGRCHYHQSQVVDRLEGQLAETPDDSPEHAELAAKLQEARSGLLKTRTGLEQHIGAQTGSAAGYDAVSLTSTINEYVADSPDGKPLHLPGGTFRVTRAHTSHGHTVLEVTGPTSARTYSSGLSDRYDANYFGKQVTRATPTELQRDFATMLVVADGRAGAAVRDTGEISALYSDSSHRGASRALLPVAVQHGGTHLECFDTFLPQLYARSGFIKVATIPFNRDFAPEGWDYQAMSKIAPPRGEPEIVFMVSSEQHEKLDRPGLKTFNDYDEADAYTRTGRIS